MEGKVGRMPLGIRRALPFSRQGAAAAVREVCGVQGEGQREGKGLWELYFAEGKVGRMPVGIHRMLPFARQGAAAAVRESWRGQGGGEREKALAQPLIKPLDFSCQENCRDNSRRGSIMCVYIGSLLLWDLLHI